jgi:hypothetical protein
MEQAFLVHSMSEEEIITNILEEVIENVREDKFSRVQNYVEETVYPVKNILKMRQNSNLRHKTMAYLLHF